MQAELKGSLIAEFPYICGRLFFFLRPSTDLTSHIMDGNLLYSFY